MEVKTTEIYILLWQKVFPLNNEKENKNSAILDMFVFSTNRVRVLKYAKEN
jgi:hypothetical protein